MAATISFFLAFEGRPSCAGRGWSTDRDWCGEEGFGSERPEVANEATGEPPLHDQEEQVRITGIDKAMKNLSMLQRNAQELHGERRVALHELYPPSFMAKYTEYAAIQEMIQTSGVFADIGEQDEARVREAFHDQAWSDFVNRHTRFSGWEEMRRTAGKEYVAAQLFKGLR